MSNHKQFTRTAIVLALSAIFPVTAAYADDDVEALTNPNVTDVSANLPYINKINPLYRQYNGINHEGLNGNADINIVNRDADGNWFKLRGENLGLSTQEAGVSYEKQGDWAVGLDYNQIPRYAPYEINSNTKGIGSNTITQSSPVQQGINTATPGTEVTLKTQRDITTFTASKYLLEGLKASFSFKNENKTGARMSGVRGEGSTGGGTSATGYPYQAFLFAPEPIDQRHNQFEATLDYSTAKLQISAGYYGSYLTNNNDTLTINGSTGAMPYQAVAGAIRYSPISPIALAPDNSLNQFFVNSAYNFTEDTRGNLKVSYSQGIQNDQFGYQPGNLGIGGITAANPQYIPAVTGGSLDGKVQTTEIFASLTSKVTKDLKLLASWRYEDKNDKTPLRNYGANLNVAGYYNSFTTNNPESHFANWGKAEADYRLGGGYAVTAGIDYTSKTQLDWVAVTNNASNGYQNPEYHYSKKVSELTSRLALRKMMSETLNGTLTFAHSSRDGSERQLDGPSAPPQYPVYLADRTRNKVRGLLDWSVIEDLNLQMAYEAYFDDFNNSTYGLDKGNGQVWSLDASYVLSDNWKFNAWYSLQTSESKQYAQGAVCTTADCSTTTARAGVPLVQWDALLKSNSNQFGFGLKGKIQMVDIGAQYLFSQDKNTQDISSMPAKTQTAVGVYGNVAAGMGVLPDTKYTQNTFKLFGIYPLAKDSKLRLDYIYDLRKMDDYTWTNWVYADGTRVYQDPKQTTQIIGLSLIQSF